MRTGWAFVIIIIRDNFNIRRFIIIIIVVRIVIRIVVRIVVVRIVVVVVRHDYSHRRCRFVFVIIRDNNFLK